MNISTYKPAPGTPESRAVELMRFLPAGTRLRSSELFKRIEAPGRGTTARLMGAVNRGLLQREKRIEPGRSKPTVFWMAGTVARATRGEVTALARDALRYHWMRAAWLEGVEDDVDPVTQQAIGSVQTEAEMDEVIDAQIAAGNWPVRP